MQVYSVTWLLSGSGALSKLGKKQRLYAGRGASTTEHRSHQVLGQEAVPLNLPAVGSLSITLDSLWTRSHVSFDPQLDQDEFHLNGELDTVRCQRVSRCLDVLRQRAQVSCFAKVMSENNFPTEAGLASSSSGFAALVLAGCGALGLDLGAEEHSEIARRCSGSAARSIFGGFVELDLGHRDDGSDAIAHSLIAPEAWPLQVVVAITSDCIKPVGSTEGMQRTAQSSPYYAAWIENQRDDLDLARSAIRSRDFDALAHISEHNCLKMHGLALSARPALIYWNGATVEGMHCVKALRTAGTAAFFTVDAGPQVKVICQPSETQTVMQALRSIPGVLRVLSSNIGQGARLI